MNVTLSFFRPSRTAVASAIAILLPLFAAASAYSQTAIPTTAATDAPGSVALNGPTFPTSPTAAPVAEIPTVAPTTSSSGSPAPTTGSTGHGKPQPRPSKGSERLCNGGIFKPCTCWTDVPKTVKYNPSDARCGRSTYPGDGENFNASISLGGEFRNAFSVVVRTFENADRSPYESSLCSGDQFRAGLNRCSRWKSQREYRGAATRLVCLGASGYSGVFKNVRRMTIKVSDRVAANGLKDIRRYCLRSPSMRLN